MFTGTSLEVKLVRSWNFRVSFEIVGWDIIHDFVYFSDLEQLAASFLATNVSSIMLESSIQTVLKFE